MDNNKIKVFTQGKYRTYDYDFFIDCFVKSFFFVKDKKSVEQFMFNILKIEEEDKLRIIFSFKEKQINYENYLKNKQDDENYYENLCNYLFHIGFHLIDKTSKEKVLDMLKVNDFNRNKVLKLFLKT